MPKIKGQPREEIICIRLRTEEKTAIEKAASESTIPPAEWVRLVALAAARLAKPSR